jgi:trehalose 6-phosphate synthase/phosphatase
MNLKIIGRKVDGNMSKIVFISNRLPVTVSKTDGDLEYNRSIGGLATGLKSFHEHAKSIWAGWPGLTDEQLTDNEKKNIRRKLKTGFQCLPVFLTEQEVNHYYYGFCNNTIWPLFHYFAFKTEYNEETWEAYKNVNQKFFEEIESTIGETDTVWIHDYQLMLLPQLIKERFPKASVGFFLHIPFPSYELFRLLVWREELLRGVLGADLIGFHTYDYVRHFLSSARRLLGLEHNLNKLTYEDRYIQVDAFPMGIDYDYFSGKIESEEYKKEFREIEDNKDGTKMILSIDRLDYTKGIPQRIRAFEQFLELYPEYQGKVRLNLIVAPSRTEVDSYDELRREIKELVSEINGKYGTVHWMPIWFFFQTFSQESLIAFYRHADMLLVTPLRDGMNLVAKEYTASCTDYLGMVVISETAGAASEMGEAIVVNANDSLAIARGIKDALDMPPEEKIAINKIIHKRLKRYNVEFWAGEFISSLLHTALDSVTTNTQISIEKNSGLIENAYSHAKKRVLFLDYDGTLVGFKPTPEQAKPDEEIKNILRTLSKDPKNTVVIISGRDRYTLDKWLGDINLHFFASHGLWVRHPGRNWRMTVQLDNAWKKAIAHMLELYTVHMPGSLIEEKDYSLAFHYRQCEPDMTTFKLNELKEALMSMTETMSLEIQEGNKVLEIKDNRVKKGYGAVQFLQNQNYDFILGVGDDFTDEDLFASLPKEAFTIKIGVGSSAARYNIKSWQSMRSLLQRLINTR